MLTGTNWLKLYREIQESIAWDACTAQGRLVMLIVLMNCNYREGDLWIAGARKTLEPGQWLTSIEEIRKRAGRGMSVQNIRTALAALKSTGFLTWEPTGGDGRIITVNNWKFYQEGDGVTGGATPKPTKKSQGVNSNQRKKELKTTKEKTTKKEKFEAEAQEIYDYYKSHVRAGAPADAKQHIVRLICKEKFTKVALIDRVDAYRKSEGFPDDPQFRIQANNFFGQKRRFEDDFESTAGDRFAGLEDDYEDVL